MSDQRMLHPWSFAALVQSAKDNPDHQEEYYEQELIS